MFPSCQIFWRMMWRSCFVISHKPIKWCCISCRQSHNTKQLIAARTKSALQAKKTRGFRLGNPEHLMDKHEQAIQNSIRTCREKADNNPNNKRAVAMLRTLVKEEHTLQEIADILNKEGFVTSKGGRFYKSTVYKLIRRYNLK